MHTDITLLEVDVASLLNRLITRRSLFKTAGAAGAVAATASTTSCAKKSSVPTKLAIVYTNDTHGHDLLDEESLGLAAAVQLRKDYEDKGYEVLLMDAGDAVQGLSMVNHSHGESAIDFMNTCGYDVMCLGNHEFDFGQDKLMEYVAQANFPLVSANVFVDATGENLVEPHTVFTLANGTKVGVFGLVSPETYTSCNPLFVRGLTFYEGDELYACAQSQADELRAQGCELVVCLAHLGETEALSPSRTMDVVAHTSGIDIFIDAHDHEEENQLLANADGVEVPVVETGCYMHAIGVVTWEDNTLTPSFVKFGSYDGQDAAVAQSIQQVADDVNAELSEVVGTTSIFLNGGRKPGVRNRETNLGDFIADAVLWEAQQMADDTPDCVLVNGGGIRESIKPGDITLGMLRDASPFINYVNTIKVTGAQLLEAIEASCCVLPEEMGGFPQVSNLSYTVDTRVPYEPGELYPNSIYEAPANPGARVTIHDVGGRGFDLNETYTVAASDFVCAGGDSYYVFGQAATKTMKTIGYLLYDCIQYYLQEACGGEVPEDYADPDGQGRIEIVM